MSWEPIQWASLGERPPAMPTIGGLVYPGRRHVFSGPPEAAKTFAAFALAIPIVRNGETVLHVDFEMFAYETRQRLREMGITPDELERVKHVEPDVPPRRDVIYGLVDEWKPTLAIIDAAAGAFALADLDDSKRQDAEKFAALMLEPLRVRGVASVVLDHVTKNVETRGRFAIGSERKIGGADVHLGFEPVTPFARGRTGLIRIFTHKDRFGYLPRPRAAELELRSDPETHAITWDFRPAAGEEGEADTWRPTVLMEKVSRYLESQSKPVSRNSVESDVKGKRDYVREAVTVLVAEGYVTESVGPRNARLLASVRPFRDLAPTSPPPRPGEDTRHLALTSPAPYKGGEVEGEDEGEVERLAELARGIGIA